MHIPKIYLIVGAFLLAVLTAIPLFSEGLSGMSTPFKASTWTLQYFADLVIALSIVMFWMWHDCRSRGKNPWPWIIATFITGSFSPLVYLLLRQR